MFMQKGNTFLPQGDGGFINYSFNTDGSCTHTAGMFLCSTFQLHAFMYKFVDVRSQKT